MGRNSTENDMFKAKSNIQASYACSRYASCYSLYTCTRAFGPRYGEKLPLTIEV